MAGKYITNVTDQKKKKSSADAAAVCCCPVCVWQTGWRDRDRP